jgi:hypothetical protein
MGAMFSGIQDRFRSRYNVTIHSTDPWVVTFEDFLTEDEMLALISSVGRFQRSTDTGLTNEFGVYFVHSDWPLQTFF